MATTTRSVPELCERRGAQQEGPYCFPVDFGSNLEAQFVDDETEVYLGNVYSD